MSTSIWDTPGMTMSSDYIKFEQPGDTVTGVVLGVEAHKWDDGSVSPKLILDCDGVEKSLTAGQVRLKAALAEKRPKVGDSITITLTEIEKRSGGKTLKHFDVTVGAAADAATDALNDAQKAARALLGMDA